MCLVQQSRIDRPPVAVEGLDLVRDRDVGVQVRVAGTGVAMRERHRDHALYVDLSYAVRAEPGVERLLFEVVQARPDGSLVAALDHRRELGIGQSPQGRDRLGRRKGQVEPGYRHRCGLRPAHYRAEQFAVGGRRSAELADEELAAQLRPQLRLDVVGHLRPCGSSGGGVPGFAAGLEFCAEAVLTGIGADAEGCPEPSHLLHLVRRQPGLPGSLAELGRERVFAAPEQVVHLLLGHQFARRHA